MLETGEVLWMVLAALGLGAVLPVMVQLFLVLRQVRHTMARLSDQVEPSLRLFNEMAQRPREPQSGGSQVAAIIATLIPAAVAAYRAFRQHSPAEDTDPDSLAKTKNSENEQ